MLCRTFNGILMIKFNVYMISTSVVFTFSVIIVNSICILVIKREYQMYL